MKKLLRIIEIVIIIAAVGIVGGPYIRDFVTSKLNGTNENATSNVKIVKEKLETAAELNTGSYLCTDVITYEDSKEFKNWNIPFTKKSFIIQYDGTVKAGIKDLTEADITEDGNTITVTLPDVEITSTDIDNDSFKEIDASSNILNQITTEDLNEAQKDLKKKMKKRAKEKGILDLARDNAETIVAEMLKSPDNDYEIKIEWK